MTDTIEIRRDKLAYDTYFTDYDNAQECAACAVGQFAQQQDNFVQVHADTEKATGSYYHDLLAARGVDVVRIIQTSDVLARPHRALSAEYREDLEQRIIDAFAKGGVVATFTGEYPT